MKRQRFTLVELFVVVAVIGIAAAIFSPIIARAKDEEKSNPCQENLKKMAQSMQLYAKDYNGILPIAQSSDGKMWMDYLDKYTCTTREQRMKYDISTPFHCPTALSLHPDHKKTVGTTYGANGYTLSRQDFIEEAGEWTDMDVVPRMKLPKLTNPEKCMAFTDGHWDKDSWTHIVDVNAWAYPELIHDDGANFAFYDGHAEWIKRADVPGVSRDPFWWPFGMRK